MRDIMEIMGPRIKEARKVAGLSQDQLAQLIGEASGRVISEWERGRSQPSANKSFTVARALNVSPNYLYGYTEEGFEATPLEQDRIQRMREIDAPGIRTIDAVISCEWDRCAANVVTIPAGRTRPINRALLPVSAGTGIELAEENMDTVEIPLTPISRQADFILQVSGDSMEPDFHSGDWLLIKSTPTVEVGQLGIFGIGNQAFFKKRGKTALLSLNHAYPPIAPGPDDLETTFGRVLGKTKIID